MSPGTDCDRSVSTELPRRLSAYPDSAASIAYTLAFYIFYSVSAVHAIKSSIIYKFQTLDIHTNWLLHVHSLFWKLQL